MTDSALITTDLAPDAMAIYDRLSPLKDALGLKDLTVPEMQLFAMVAAHTGLDPFTRQIYAIKRGGKVTHQTGIDGYRSTAERAGGYAGSDEATYEACECGDEGSPAEHPKIARVVVHRILPDGHVVDQMGIARWHELKPEHRKPQNAYEFLDAMWWRMPFNQLAKCAEANGLRKAFPRVLGNVYIAEEMEQARVIEAEPVAPRPTLAERAAAKAAEVTVMAEPMTPEVSAQYANPEEIAEGAPAIPAGPVARTGLSAHELIALATKAGRKKADLAAAIGCDVGQIVDRVGSMSDVERGVLADELNLDWR